LWARAVPRTVQVVTDGIVRYLIGAWVRVHVLVELNVACDGVTENAQPAGFPTCDRKVAPDCVVLEVSVGRSEQHGQENRGAGDGATALGGGSERLSSLCRSRKQLFPEP